MRRGYGRGAAQFFMHSSPIPPRGRSVLCVEASTRSCGRNILCLGACMGVEGSWKENNAQDPSPCPNRRYQ